MATVKSSIQAGFDGYLLKSEDRETVKQALQLVYEGEQCFLVAGEGSFFQQGVAIQKPALTKREIEIFTIDCGRKNDKEIGEHLFISKKTVEITG
ncbi:MAG: hypothetical protein KL787_08595 [Taibaiella sp.]|nr:hypothetical protein [Taibaiella sp.]